MQEPVEQVDIAIVGGGMVGLALAKALVGGPGKTALTIAVLDAGKAPLAPEQACPAASLDNFSPRVSALTMASQQKLKELGAWQHMANGVQHYQGMRVWDALGTEEIAFSAAEVPSEALGCIVENRRVIAALYAALQDESSVSLRWETRLEGLQQVEDHSCLLSLGDGHSLKANMLIGADGALSRVRQLAQMPTREWDYQHQAIVCTVQTSESHQATAWQRFDESGPLAFLPLADQEDSQRFCSIVWSQQHQEAERLMQCDDQAFAKELEQAIEQRLGEVVAVSQRHCFPLRQRHAKNYVQDHIALVGDAAHSIHPLAGQGVNLGFKDVAVLSREIKAATSQGLPPWQPHFLSRYQRERQVDNLMMMGVMEGFKRLFEQSNPVVRLLRNSGMGWVNRQAPLKNLLVKQAMGL